jgi:valyl-tRNA synthetase
MLHAVAAVLGGVRGAKSQAKVSMRTELARATVSGPAESMAHAALAVDDLRAAGKITGELVFAPTEDDTGAIGVDAQVAEPAV